jgi:hypothetical protein
VLVYCSHFYLTPENGKNSVLECVARWLGQRSKGFVDPAKLLHGTNGRLPDGSRIEASSTSNSDDTQAPFLASIRLSHPDNTVSGRQWLVEVGIRQDSPEDPIFCSILTEANDISPRVISPIQVTRPRVIQDLVNNCSPVPSTPGLSPKTLDESTARGLLTSLEATDRLVPWVVVSPTKDGRYLVNLSRLRSLLFGIAECVEIPPAADTYEIERLFGSNYASWLGALNIIFPRRRGRSYCENKRLLPDDLDQIIEEGGNAELEILSLVAHRTNLPNSWKHLSSAMVANFKLRQQLDAATRRLGASADGLEYVELFEIASKELKDQEAHMEDLQSEIEDRDSEIYSIRVENENLKHALIGKRSSAMSSDSSMLAPITLREDIAAILSKKANLEQALSTISTLYSDRIFVLDSAYRSAANSKEFRHTGKAYDLLFGLANQYWDGMATGKGDGETRKIFGSAYAAKESEILSDDGVKRRTFLYNSKSVAMMKHLKIGVKDSVGETLRIHFEWIPTEKKIVIGYCGQHLSF